MIADPTAADAETATVTKLTDHLQTAAVFVSWGWRLSAWRRIPDSLAGRRRGEFRFAIPAADEAQAQRVVDGWKTDEGPGTPHVSLYNRAFRDLKRLLDERQKPVLAPEAWVEIEYPEER